MVSDPKPEGVELEVEPEDVVGDGFVVKLDELVLSLIPNESRMLPKELSSAMRDEPKSSSPSPFSGALKVGVVLMLVGLAVGGASCCCCCCCCWGGGVLLSGGAMVVVRGGGLATGAKELKTRSDSVPGMPEGDWTEGASEETETRENRVPL